MTRLSDTFRAERSDHGDTIRWTLWGCIDERANLAQFETTGEATTLVFHLASVHRINSVGVRNWIHTMRSIPDHIRVIWEHTSVPLIQQMTMIANFHGHSEIQSFMAPYYCESCDTGEDKLLMADAKLLSPPYETPPAQCSTCGQDMVFEEMAEDYLSAVQETQST